MQALVINGTRTHDPDVALISELGRDILRPAFRDGKITDVQEDAIINFFTMLNEDNPAYIEKINEVAPKAYAAGKKRSRVFKSICTALGIADETAGSEFQRLYAQFADELSAKRIGFKLFVSINPAHFITMSNPKSDHRGNTLTSCHSFNSTEYNYNNGCTGYARDEVSFIAFTAADPKDPETLNNRKTTRQVYAYEPGNGVLLQSRLYNTSGGTRGAQEESKLYRDLIQREISALEGAPNLWKTFGSTGEYSYLLKVGDGFGGYPDWQYSEFDAKVSIRNDCSETKHPLIIGRYGRCVCCGYETSDGVYCDDCKRESSDCETCDECGECCDETYHVYDRRGNDQYVCESCRDEYYSCCDRCDEYYPSDSLTHCTDGNYVCENCRDNYYFQCDDCGEWAPEDERISVNDDEAYICSDCYGNGDYWTCEDCGHVYSSDHMHSTEFGELCDDCYERKMGEKEEDEAV
ncbi:MAG: hypothetical protein IJ192_03940 [Clostridia bacterium]|nr:hypothetical protein [Clostridia bacterium]